MSQPTTRLTVCHWRLYLVIIVLLFDTSLLTDFHQVLLHTQWNHVSTLSRFHVNLEHKKETEAQRRPQCYLSRKSAAFFNLNQVWSSLFYQCLVSLWGRDHWRSATAMCMFCFMDHPVPKLLHPTEFSHIWAESLRALYIKRTLNDSARKRSMI